MKAENIRSRDDLNLYNSLLKEPDVIRVNESIKRAEQKGPYSTRRHLLSTSIRLSPQMAPTVHSMKDECAEKLGLDIPLELYVYNSPQFNAACFKPEDGRLFIMFSSSLLEAFTGSELRFVMGHELGHHLYQHHDIPIGYILKGSQKPSPKLALQLFSWSRYAEISADRAGALCANDLQGVARSLFRLSSGLSDNVIQFSLDDFLAQMDDMQEDEENQTNRGPKEDWFSTHPFSPLRVKALQLFHNSEHSCVDGMSTDDLEIGVHSLMGFMEPSYLDGRTRPSEIMRRLLFSGSIAVINASGEVTDEEISKFESFFGDHSLSEKLNVDKIIKDLPERIQMARENTSISQRMQVLRDLCLMVVADNKAGLNERAVVIDIAEALNVSPAFAETHLDVTRELD